MNKLVAMAEVSDVDALMGVISTAASPEATRGLAFIVVQAAAGLTLSVTVAAMITDLFGGSDPRKVAEAARGALALYSVTKHLGTGSDLLQSGGDDHA